jgi:hypothetical protein
MLVRIRSLESIPAPPIGSYAPPPCAEHKKAGGRDTVGFLFVTAGSGLRCHRESDATLGRFLRLEFVPKKLIFRVDQSGIGLSVL